MPGAGKDEFIKVALERDMLDLHMGNTVKHYAKESGIEMQDSQIGKFASQERDKYGKSIWAKRTMKDLASSKDVIIDGLRNVEELEYMREVEKNLVVVAIFANRKERLSRILKRKREDDVDDLKGLVSRDSRELSWGIGSVIALADYMIVNDGTLEEFKEKVRSLLGKL